MSYSSKLLEEAVEALSRLPGIGKKTALRLAIHLISQDKDDMGNLFIKPLQAMISDMRFCSDCHNISDHEQCNICRERQQRSKVICVVESIRDVMAIEETGQFNGLYHVLGGVISPLDGITAEDLTIDRLITRVEKLNIEEIILAISPTIEGETTIYYISKSLKNHSVKITQLARGIAFGGELEYADELTLGRSIITRLPYNLSEL
jgi:recombination protein RecR